MKVFPLLRGLSPLTSLPARPDAGGGGGGGNRPRARPGQCLLLTLRLAIPGIESDVTGFRNDQLGLPDLSQPPPSWTDLDKRTVNTQRHLRVLRRRQILVGQQSGRGSTRTLNVPEAVCRRVQDPGWSKKSVGSAGIQSSADESYQKLYVIAPVLDHRVNITLLCHFNKDPFLTTSNNQTWRWYFDRQRNPRPPPNTRCTYYDSNLNVASDYSQDLLHILYVKLHIRMLGGELLHRFNSSVTVGKPPLPGRSEYPPARQTTLH